MTYLNRDLTFEEQAAMVAVLEGLQHAIGYEFEDKDLLFTVCLPRLSQEREFVFNRLEELGDNMYDAVLASEYYFKYPELNGRGIALPIHQIVSNKQMKEDVLAKGFDAYFHFFSGFPKRRLSDHFEALLGAVYVDGGFNALSKVVVGNLLHELEDKEHYWELLHNKKR